MDTIEKVKATLAALDIVYTVQTFQVEPLILMLKIESTDQVIMETGKVYNEVLMNLLKKSVIYYNTKICAEQRRNFMK